MKIFEKYDKSTLPWVLSIVDDKNLGAGTNRLNSMMILVIEENIKVTIFPNILFFSFLGQKAEPTSSYDLITKHNISLNTFFLFILS